MIGFESELFILRGMRLSTNQEASSVHECLDCLLDRTKYGIDGGEGVADGITDSEFHSIKRTFMQNGYHQSTIYLLPVQTTSS